MTEEQETYAVVPVDNAMLPVDVNQAMVEWEAYQDLTERLLDKTDYQTIHTKAGPRRFKKKSAWRKYAKAFNLSCEIVDKAVERGEDGKIHYADFVVRATAPSGRYAEAWASCSRGERDFSHDQDVAATAQTRAENRAISDLIGAGEVSAEEMAKPGRAGTQGAQGSAPRPLEPAEKPPSPDQLKTIKAWLHEVSEEEAYDLCDAYGIGIQTKQDGRHYGDGVDAAGLTGGIHGTASQLLDELSPLIKKMAKGKPAPKGAVEMADPRVPEPTPVPTPSDFPSPTDIKTRIDFQREAYKYFTLQPRDALAKAGLKSALDVSDWPEVWSRLLNAMGEFA